MYIGRIESYLHSQNLAPSFSSTKKNVSLINVKNFNHFCLFTQFRRHQFSSIQLLAFEETVAKLSEKYQKPLTNTAVFYVHHSLQTTVPVINALLNFGVKPQRFFAIGKSYSDCPEVTEACIKLGIHYQHNSRQTGLGKYVHSFIADINALWSKVESCLEQEKDVQEVLILDHGGYALQFTPANILEKYKVVGLEKTTGGVINFESLPPPFPVITVATCAAKKVLESPLIANSIVNKICYLMPIINDQNVSVVCGIVGSGAIGKAITEKLVSMGYDVIVYDNNPNQLRALESTLENAKVTITNDLSKLIDCSEYIFGCTGRDITANPDHLKMLLLADKDKRLVSCSSGDNEFSALLKYIQQRRNIKKIINPLDTVIYATDKGANIKILRGGFPVNFDQSGESVPAKDIQLTRALVVGGVIQAAYFFNQPHLLTHGGLYGLDAGIQQLVVNTWLKHQPTNRFPEKVTTKFLDLEWIRDNTEGIHISCDVVEQSNSPKEMELKTCRNM
jgi:S-adenosylhomocysteine hydrolase